MIQVLETTLEQIKERLGRMRTNLNKADYLEGAFKKDLSIEIKKFILETLTQIYEQDRMYSKAAKAMSNKARFDSTFKERIISYTKAAEFFCKIGSIEDSEDMFNRAFRESNEVEKLDIIKIRKEMYFSSAEQLEKIGKKSSALKFYEKLIKMRLDELEKEKVKEKLVRTYKLLGRFNDADVISAL
jgi:tetratricopeptide (TPR) repeat protein